MLKKYIIYSPSMTANTEIDRKLKNGLLDDAFTILDFEKMFYFLLVIKILINYKISKKYINIFITD